jgi:hypothetical protein
MDPSKTSFKSQLHAAMTAQFVRTKRGWKRVLGLGAVLFLLSMVSVLVGTMRIAVVVDFLSLLCGIGVVLVRVHVQDLYGQAEALRRAYYQLEGSGIRPRDSLASELPTSVRGVDLGVIVPDREYYGTSAMPGPDRLADNLEEAAVYTRALARRAWQLCAIVLGVGVILVLGLLYVATTVGTDGAGLLKIVPHVFSFFILGFAIDLCMAFGRLETAAIQTLDRLELLHKGDGLRIDDLIPAITDYDCALAATGAPLPDFLYASMEPELGARWKAICARRHSQRAPVAPGAARQNQQEPPKVKADLSRLLARIFDDFELRKFVEEMEDPELNASLLDTDVRFDAVVSQFVATLGRRGRIDQDLFAALEVARPNKAAEIREVARLALPAKEPHG